MKTYLWPIGRVIGFSAFILGCLWTVPGFSTAQTATPTLTPWPQPCGLDTVWGGPGNAVGQFSSLRTFDVHEDTLYVADMGNNRIQRFTLGGVVIPPSLTAGGSLTNPFGVATDAAGFVYVAETGSVSSRILKINPATDQAAATLQVGTDNYCGLTVDSDGDVYVTLVNAAVTVGGQNVSECVRKFHEIAPNVWVQAVTLAGASWSNSVLATGGGATVCVADTGGDRIKQYLEVPPGSNQYVFDLDVVPGGTAPGQTVWPHQLKMDGNGFFYLTDVSRRVEVFNPAWQFQYQCRYPNLTGNLYGLALDGSGNIYVGVDNIWKFHASVMPGGLPPAPTPTPVPCNDQNQTAFVYPTPLRGGVGHFGMVLCKAGIVRVAIYNALGDIAGKAEFAGVAGDNRFAFDFNGFAQGVYYYLVEINGSRQRPGKFAVVR